MVAMRDDRPLSARSPRELVGELAINSLALLAIAAFAIWFALQRCQEGSEQAFWMFACLAAGVCLWWIFVIKTYTGELLRRHRASSTTAPDKPTSDSDEGRNS